MNAIGQPTGREASAAEFARLDVGGPDDGGAKVPVLGITGDTLEGDGGPRVNDQAIGRACDTDLRLAGHGGYDLEGQTSGAVHRVEESGRVYLPAGHRGELAGMGKVGHDQELIADAGDEAGLHLDIESPVQGGRATDPVDDELVVFGTRYPAADLRGEDAGSGLGEVATEGKDAEGQTRAHGPVVGEGDCRDIQGANAGDGTSRLVGQGSACSREGDGGGRRDDVEVT